MKIKISCERWSIPDYKRGETEEDSHLKKLEIESDTLNTKRFSVDLEDEEVLTWLKIVQNVVRASIKAEEEKLNKRS